MSYVQLTLQERYVIYHSRLCNFSLREIARRLKRHHSTLAREIKRNSPRYPGFVYWHELAQAKAIERRHLARHHRRRTNGMLCQYVLNCLKAHWSPQMIAGRLKLSYPHDESMRISPKAIYRWIYLDAKEGGQLYTCLTFRHRRRRKQRSSWQLARSYPRADIDRRAPCGGGYTPALWRLGGRHALRLTGAQLSFDACRAQEPLSPRRQAARPTCEERGQAPH
jgi:IS30 family transposase